MPPRPCQIALVLVLALATTTAAAAQHPSAYKLAKLTADIEDSLAHCDAAVGPPKDSNTVAVQAFIQRPLTLDSTTGLVNVPTGAALQAAYEAVTEKCKRQPQRTLKPENLQLEAVTATAGSNEATIITGVTDFIVARARDELVEAFLSDLQDRLTKVPFLGKLFPQTSSVLLTQLDAVFTSALVPTLRAAVIGGPGPVPLSRDRSTNL
jgi:hypothetical protein